MTEAWATAFVFPAFEMKYASYDIRRLEGFMDLLAEALQELGPACDLSLEQIVRAYGAEAEYARLSDEQKHQLCYVGSCMLADYVRDRGLAPAWIAPYSMGLFAGLYAARCVSFRDGFALMRHVCRTAHQVGRHRQGYGMASVVGLGRSRVEGLIKALCREVAVSDEMSDKVLVLSGKRAELALVVEKAKEDGAFHAKLLNVELPYHSDMMREAEDLIAAYAAEVPFRDPVCPMVACTDQKILTTAQDVRREVCVNVVRPLHWRSTVEALLAHGVDCFVECGFCENLSKMLKMSVKHVEVFHPKRFHKLGLNRPVDRPGDNGFLALSGGELHG